MTEDSKEGKKARRGSDHDAITSDALFDILEESIRTIWRFIRADKNANAAVRKRRSRGKEAEVLQDPADLDLLHQVRNELQKVKALFFLSLSHTRYVFGMNFR